MSNKALNLLKLAVQACKAKQYDDAGVLLANASSCEDIGDFLNLDLDAISSDADLDNLLKGESTESTSVNSESGFKRRRVNSLHRIDTDDDYIPEPNPDLPGEESVPHSFSSAVQDLQLVRGVKSPIRLK